MSTEITPTFRVSFPNVFEPDKRGKYAVTMLFDEDADLSDLKRLVKAAAKERWGDNLPKGLDLPFKDQGDKDYDGYQAGCKYAKAKSKTRPGIVYGNNKPLFEEQDFYAGCYAKAQVTAYAYGGPGTEYDPGVSLGLSNLQKQADGEPFSGRMKAEDAFEPITAGSESDSDVDDGDDLFD